MKVHVEHRDFRVLMESFHSGMPAHTVLGIGGAIQPGDLIETHYRGTPERWRVRGVSFEDSDTVWSATVVPAPVLKLVA